MIFYFILIMLIDIFTFRLIFIGIIFHVPLQFVLYAGKYII